MSRGSGPRDREGGHWETASADKPRGATQGPVGHCGGNLGGQSETSGHVKSHQQRDGFEAPGPWGARPTARSRVLREGGRVLRAHMQRPLGSGTGCASWAAAQEGDPPLHLRLSGPSTTGRPPSRRQAAGPGAGPSASAPAARSARGPARGIHGDSARAVTGLDIDQ